MATPSSPGTPSSILPDTPPLTLSSLVSTETSPTNPDNISMRIEKLRFMLKHLQDLKEQIEASKRGPGTATTFPQFPKLPVELRLKVFHEVLSTQEIFAIGWETRRESTELNGSQVFDWEDYVPRIGSWHDFEVQAPSMTGKASLLGVNSEARMEALKVLQVLEIKSQSAWFNADVDVAWFPRFKLSNGQMRDEGFLVDHKLQRVTLRYKSWVEPDDLEVRSCTYRFFGEKALRELTLTVGIKDLLPATGKRKITAGSKPSEFHGMVARSMDPEEEHTWQIMEEEEMENMRDWNEDRMWDRNFLGSNQANSSGRAWTVEELDDDPDTVDDITVPNIKFRLEIGTSFLLG